MKKLQSVEDIDRIIRKQLIEQSELDGEFVRNASSEYGIDLDKPESDSIFVSIAPTDLVLLFEVEAQDSDDDVSETNDNDEIDYYKSYRVRCIIYGDEACTLANKLCGRFRTEYVRQSLRSDGIYFRSAGNIVTVHEFKNNVKWLRTDFELNIACKMAIPLITDNTIYDELGTVELIET